MPRVVVALGGNALLRRGDEDSAEVMRKNARKAAERVADVAEHGWEIVVTHGNGPQVGRILLQNEAASEWVHPMPLDVCGAESQGQIGYLLQVTIGDVFYERGMERPVATVITFARVRPDDPAFEKPTKPIGPHYEEAQAKRLAEERGWVVAQESEGKWRRVVPSPRPYSIVEAPVIRQLAESGAIVIAGGGGGVPVIEQGPRLVGVEAVVDKDLASALLAADLRADLLLMLTDIDRVERGYDTPAAEPIDRIDVATARSLLDDGEFPSGSMGPKVEAACRFAIATGHSAVITSIPLAEAAVEGTAGTRIVP